MSALDLLAKRVGIEPEFQDATGEIRRTTPGVARGLLEAMGLPAANEREARATLERLEAEEARRILPTVVTTTASGAPLAIPVSVPVGTETLRWEIREEAGATREGRAYVRELQRMKRTSQARPEGRRELKIQAPGALGRHVLRVEGNGLTPTETTLIVAPERCWVPAGLGDERPLWGIAVQLYLLRSATNWGIGDFGDLKRFVEVAADLGAAVVGLNPLHAMFIDDPERASPYSPASRLFLNVFYIDVTAVPGFSTVPAVRAQVEDAEFQADLAASRDAELVDYAGVARLKLPVLETLHDAFLADASNEDRDAFAAFRREQGETLGWFCLFQVLRERFAAEDPELADWRRWPAAFRDISSAEVEGFAAERRDRIDFFAWLQWIADRQLAEAAAVTADRGMEIGLYRDLAVGADGGGAESWANPRTILSSVDVGAPPDILNPAGQDWGLPPFDPRALREAAYTGFAELVRANMRHAGGLRIDHVMALQHLYMIPEGRPPAEGAYVAYPMDGLIAVLALESRRHLCLVVGEDLGTVPEGFRDRMEAAGILSYRVVFFEQDEDGVFVAPDAYPPLALAVLGSHDLATLRGWWEGRDIDLKAEHDLYPNSDEEARQRTQRKAERAAFLEALVAAELLAEDEVGIDTPFGPHLAEAAHAFLARTRSGLAVAQLDDLLGEADQVNLPGTVDQHPNWRRKHAVPIEEIADDVRVRALVEVVAGSRCRGSERMRAGNEQQC